MYFLSLGTSFLVLLLATITDLKERIVPNKLNFVFVVSGLLFMLCSAQPLTHFYIWPFICLLMLKETTAPGDIKLFIGLSLWNSFGVMLWVLLISTVLRLLGHLLLQKKELPAVPFIFTSYITVFILFSCFPVISLLYK